jgi:hypothetical protein
MLEDRMAYFIDLVERNEPGEIEMARDVVTREDVGPLVEAYWTLATWDEKAALVNGRAFASSSPPWRWRPWEVRFQSHVDVGR